MALHTDYRPKTFKGYVGNEGVIASLRAKLSRKDRPRVFLLTGQAGSGKTTLARIIAGFLGAYDPSKPLHNNPDYIEMDAASLGGVDTARGIRRNVGYKARAGENRVYLLDECHKLTKDAQEALLKTLEEPPSHVYFILATTEPEALKDTFKRRCLHYHLDPLDYEEMEKLVRRVIKKSGRDIKLPESVMDILYRDSFGSPGIALSILEKIVDLKPKQMERIAAEEASRLNASIDLCRILMKKGVGWKDVCKVLNGLKEEPEKVRRAVLGYYTSILLKGGRNDLARKILECFEDNYYSTGRAGLVSSCYDVLFS